MTLTTLNVITLITSNVITLITSTNAALSGALTSDNFTPHMDNSVSWEPPCLGRCDSQSRSHEGEVMSSSSFAPKPLQVAATVVGNALEWYDFIVFGFFAVVIARLFFPTESQYASLLLTTATFGVGFFMRPVGGVLLGIYADRRGRKAALLLIIGLMTLAIAIIGFAPTYVRHRHCSAIARCVRPPAAGLFSRRRIRQCNGISN
jgi:Sugar (and other) transporter